MGYESVSALIVLIILVALWFGWLPKHTVNGMKTMLEHREDRFSPTLHLVGEWSAARICDGTGMLAKGACMQATQQKRLLTPERIAHIRAARRAAIRRRRVLVVALAVLTFLVFLAGCTGLFSAAFALVPGAVLAIVLYFGARASSAAREWEARVAKMRAGSRRVEDALYERHNSAVVNKLSNSAEDESSAFDSEYVDYAGGVDDIDGVGDASDASDAAENADNAEDFDDRNYSDRNYSDRNYSQSNRTASRDETATSVMEQREIRVAVRRAAEERDAVLRERSKASKEGVAEAQQIELDIDDSSVSSANQGAERSANQGANQGANNVVNNGMNQDLISFSLGEKPHYEANTAFAADEPESLEIKSTKQVFKAIPVAQVEKSAKSSAKSAKTDSSKFHAEEQSSEVEAPESSADSLGVADLHDVLARRNA